jgi:nucleoside-diphosphate-sugar epimerase
MAGSLLILGAGYLGAAIARRAVAAGDDVTLADNWYATERSQAEAVSGAAVVDFDLRSDDDVRSLVGGSSFDRVILTAAQASRPLSFEDPDYTEATNVSGTRRVAQAVQAPLVFASSLHVYGGGLSGAVDASRPYGEQGDLSHLSKIYGELVLRMESSRRGFPLSVLRLGIVYGPSPVEHDRPESVTVVDKFRRLAAAGEPLPLDDGGRATIGVVHVDDAARIFHAAAPPSPLAPVAANVAAETITVADVAALAEGREPSGGASWTVESPFAYEHFVREYLAR